MLAGVGGWDKGIGERLGGCDGLYVLGPGSGTIRKYGPVGVGVSLRV